MTHTLFQEGVNALQRSIILWCQAAGGGGGGLWQFRIKGSFRCCYKEMGFPFREMVLLCDIWGIIICIINHPWYFSKLFKSPPLLFVARIGISFYFLDKNAPGFEDIGLHKLPGMWNLGSTNSRFGGQYSLQHPSPWWMKYMYVNVQCLLLLILLPAV